ncbi:MAG: T9SS type A sorting domain-containing protein, partial [Bacteroidetes bacterium]|nr:T9SS type A sorting domain-containing protein [Bacteroidota bacterium]
TGKLRIDNNGLPLRGKKIILMKDGRILVGCASYLTSSGKDQNMAVARILPNGRPDTAFALGGVFTVDFGYDDWYEDFALQSNGGILIGGTSVDESDSRNWKYYRAFARIVVDGEHTPPPDTPAQWQGFEVFPNPASGIVYIRRGAAGNAAAVSIELINVNGQVIQHKTLARDQWLTSMDTKSYPPGIYIIRISEQDGLEQRVKLILK